MPEYMDDERVLFRHQADFTRNKDSLGDGYISLTTHRIFFESKSGAVLFQTSWSNVDKDKYSPATHARVMARFELVGTDDFVVATLTGSDNLRNALEELRSQVAVSRKLATTVGAKQGRQNVAAPNSVKRMAVSSAELKSSLLDADIVLRKQYTELVTEQKIMSDDEFWATKKWLLDDISSSTTQNKRGRLISMFSEIDKEKTITVTAEVIQSIFEMYPAVRRAFEDKVPTEYSEAEFWTRYFSSEYYAQVNDAISSISHVFIYIKLHLSIFLKG